jgi:hypothetical protein
MSNVSNPLTHWTAQILIEESQVSSDINIYVTDRVKRTPKLKA